MKMSDDEMKVIYNEMLDIFGTLPNHKQEPLRFAHYVRLYRYYKNKESNE
jgi:hypothetical protein